MGYLSKRFSAALRAFPPIDAGETVVVAVSGGPDSVCLLDLIRERAMEAGFYLRVAHLNHGFRAEADEEARFVEGLASGWHIPVTVKKVDLPAFCKSRKLSKQAAARTVRYAFLEEVAQSHGARWIALGHTSDDQAETVLMRLLRGAGAVGLSGIPPVRQGRVIRPLLSFTRSEILRHLTGRRIPFVEDPSNARTDYLRNRIRHELLPILARYNPRVREVLCREAGLLREEDQFIEELLKRAFPALCARQSDGLALLAEGMRGLPPVLARRAVRWALKEIKGNLEGITSDHIASVLRLLHGPVSRKRPLPQGIVVEMDYDRILFRKHPPAPVSWAPIPLSMSGETIIPGLSLKLVSRIADGAPPSASPSEAAFDLDRVSSPLMLRPRLPGDHFYPAGMAGRKKLQDFFVDEKVPRNDRDRIPLLAAPEGILWVVGHRQDRRFAATPHSRRTLRTALSNTDAG
jgi:tRNA(Ile)-lysidine synthase